MPDVPNSVLGAVILPLTAAIGAVGAEVQEVRRIEHGAAEGEHVVEGVGGLAVDLVEGDVLLHGVAVRQERRAGRTDAGGRIEIDALPARIEVAPDADVERQRAEGRADTAIDVDLGGGAVGEGDALAGDAGIELQVRRDVVARLEIGGDRAVAVRLRHAAEYVVVHHRRAEGDIPDRHRRRRRWRLGVDLAEIGGGRRPQTERDQRRDRQTRFLHDHPHRRCDSVRPVEASLLIDGPERHSRDANVRADADGGKQKPQATAAFLGVFALSKTDRDDCCAETTALPTLPQAGQRTGEGCAPHMANTGIRRSGNSGARSI